MRLSVQCACGKSYQVDESLAGKRVKCKACGGAIDVPSKQPATPAGEEDDFRLAPLEPLGAAPVPAVAAPAAVAATQPAPAQPVSAAAAPRPSAATTPAPAASTGLPFFLAVSQGWSKSLIYRVYVDRDALLLVDVSPYNVLMDLEIARRADGKHWGVKTVKSLKSWVLGSAAVVGSVIGLLGLGIARAGFQKPNEALQLVSFLFMIVAFTVPLLILLATWTMRVLVRRSQELDALDAEGVRQEAAKGGDKYRLAPGELSGARIAPPKNPGPAIRHRAEATFKHSSGSWKLQLFAPQDVQLAVSTFRRLLGPAVEIDPALERP